MACDVAWRGMRLTAVRMSCHSGPRDMKTAFLWCASARVAGHVRLAYGEDGMVSLRLSVASSALGKESCLT